MKNNVLHFGFDDKIILLSNVYYICKMFLITLIAIYFTKRVRKFDKWTSCVLDEYEKINLTYRLYKDLYSL